MKENVKDITDTIEERLRDFINQTVEVKLKEMTQTVEQSISTLEKNMAMTVEKNVCNSTNENVEMIIKSATQLFNSINNSHMKSTASTKNTLNESPQFDILCNSCYSPIRGKRWRCETCEDFDLCSTCKCHMTHHPDHKFKFIKDDGKKPTFYTCDYCDSDIVGIRHTCTSCPDFDLCYHCFGFVQENHPPNHTFIAHLMNSEPKKTKKTKKMPQNIKKSSTHVCGHCCDYDLCEKCEEMSTKIHDERHVFLKIRWPIKSETRRPLLPKFNTPDVIEKPNEMMTDKKVPLMDATPQPPIEIKPMKPLRSNSKLTSLQEKLQAEHEARAMRMKAVEREVKSAIQQLNVGDKDVPVQSKDTCTQTNLTKVDDKETITQLPVLSQHSSTLRQLSPTLSQRSSNLSQHSLILSQHVPEQKDEEQEESESVQGASEQVPVISAQFLADLNVPDGTVVVPKKNFIKMWKVKNNGKVHWPAGSRLLFNGGGIFKPYPMSYPDGYILPSLAPGEEACITAELQSPDAPGTYTSLFCFITPEGARFGDDLWCNIDVSEEDVANHKDDDMIYPTISTIHHDSQSTATVSTDLDTLDYHSEQDSSSSNHELHFGPEDFIEDSHSSRHHSETEEEAKSIVDDQEYLLVESEENEANDEMSSSYTSTTTIKMNRKNEDFKYESELTKLHEMVE
ncbi:hypothetical protein G6F62_009340 [Rhizopus arrhizus]|nr:hypothetical protein G6F62_009340 [Rhizopus arrhizus]